MIEELAELSPVELDAAIAEAELDWAEPSPWPPSAPTWEPQPHLAVGWSGTPSALPSACTIRSVKSRIDGASGAMCSAA